MTEEARSAERTIEVDAVLGTGNLGQALLIECKRRGVSQAKASERFGVTKQTFNEWINRKRDPSPVHAKAIASFLRVPISTVRELLETPRQDRITVLEQEIEKLRSLMRELESRVDELLDAIPERLPRRANG